MRTAVEHLPYFPDEILRQTGLGHERVASSLTRPFGKPRQRMTRQREFMDAAVPLIREKINESSGFITTMIDTLTPYVTTNMVRGRMINEINRAYHYEVEPVQYLSGEHSIGEDGFVEFHADEQSIVDFVLDAFYTKKE